MESRLSKIAILEQKSADSLKAANVLLKEGLFAESLSRSYYAMFYIAKALLCSKGKSSKTHAGVLTLLGKLFIKPGIIDVWFNKIYSLAMEEKQIVDYSDLISLSKEKAVERLKEAKEFIDMALGYLEGQAELTRGT